MMMSLLVVMMMMVVMMAKFSVIGAQFHVFRNNCIMLGLSLLFFL